VKYDRTDREAAVVQVTVGCSRKIGGDGFGQRQVDREISKATMR
jgi:hypothetical protein